MSLKKDMKKLVDRARKQGWRIDERDDCWMCYSPNGSDIVNAHKTPSDQRAVRNTEARLRKGGFDSDA